MSKHYYDFYLSVGVTVESDEEFDLKDPDGFLKLRELTIKQLEQAGVEQIVKRADFGDIEHEAD